MSGYYRQEKSPIINVGLNFTTLLTVAFIVLKLCGVIEWKWFWVVSPVVFEIGLFLAIVIIYFTIAGIVDLVEIIQEKIEDKKEE